jgi:hypothetical protein
MSRIDDVDRGIGTHAAIGSPHLWLPQRVLGGERGLIMLNAAHSPTAVPTASPLLPRHSTPASAFESSLCLVRLRPHHLIHLVKSASLR